MIVSGDDWTALAAKPVVARADSGQKRRPIGHRTATAASKRGRGRFASYRI
jgi:hypothetical protein